MGWKLTLVTGVNSDDIGHLAGLDRTVEFNVNEAEVPDLIAVVSRMSIEHPVIHIPGKISAQWQGKPNALSPAHVQWEIISQVSNACGLTAEISPTVPSYSSAGFDEQAANPDPRSAGTIIRQRRSAVDMDGKSTVSRERFFTMLSRTLPQCAALPWDAAVWPPTIHLGLFVHRVQGLIPGLYALVRNADKLHELKSRMNPRFQWKPAPSAPEKLPLYLLEEGDMQEISKNVSCDQDIAGEGCFSVAMLAEFEPTLLLRGPSFYRNLFWETGMIGQVLYLEAESAGLRGTGIGCFFDDSAHRIFGLTDRTFQSLYHFTVGGAVEDSRLTTLPAYPSENKL